MWELLSFFIWGSLLLEIYNSAAPPTFLGENVPFLFLARGIVQVVINARKGKNEVKIL
jgi:hypothetical protein